MSTTTTNFRQGAVALNNIGVMLLERHCFVQARDTFQDACFLMKRVVRDGDEDNVSQKYDHHRIDVNKLIQNATNHLSNPRPMIMIHNSRIRIFNLQEQIDGLLSHHDGFMNGNTSGCSYHPFVAHPIRIDDVNFSSCVTTTSQSSFSLCHGNDDDNDDAHTDRDLESACILHNYGLSCLCWSQVVGSFGASHKSGVHGVPSTPATCERLQAAAELLRLAITVLDEHHPSRQNDLYTLRIQSMIQLVTLQSLETAMFLLHRAAAAGAVANVPGPVGGTYETNIPSEGIFTEIADRRYDLLETIEAVDELEHSMGAATVRMSAAAA